MPTPRALPCYHCLRAIAKWKPERESKTTNPPLCEYSESPSGKCDRCKAHWTVCFSPSGALKSRGMELARQIKLPGSPEAVESALGAVREAFQVQYNAAVAREQAALASAIATTKRQDCKLSLMERAVIAAEASARAQEQQVKRLKQQIKRLDAIERRLAGLEKAYIAMDEENIETTRQEEEDMEEGC